MKKLALCLLSGILLLVATAASAAIFRCPEPLTCTKGNCTGVPAGWSYHIRDAGTFPTLTKTFLLAGVTVYDRGEAGREVICEYGEISLNGPSSNWLTIYSNVSTVYSVKRTFLENKNFKKNTYFITCQGSPNACAIITFF